MVFIEAADKSSGAFLLVKVGFLCICGGFVIQRVNRLREEVGMGYLVKFVSYQRVQI
jgi:hypothetical protein